MIELVLDFLGIDYAIVWNDSLMESVLPVIVGLCCVFAFYLFVSFFEFLRSVLKRR